MSGFFDPFVIAAGQTYEKTPGSLFVVERVSKGYDNWYGETRWSVILLCVLAPARGVRSGHRAHEVCAEGTLRTLGYTRIA